MTSRWLLFPLLLLTSCATTQTTTKSTIPKETPTGIVFNTSEVLYTGGLGDAGVQGFCKRIGTQVAEKFSEIGISGITNATPSTSQAKITVSISTIESKSGVAFNWWGVGGAQKMRVRYSAQLDSPERATLATWKHEVEEESVDRLTAHMASDIVKYLKKGFK